MLGRLIIDEPAMGSWNMAVDAAILASLTPEDTPTLRFYRWAKPTLSLGYFQRLADRTRHRESQEIDVVRRASGGGAIVHDRELTYSLTFPLPQQRTGAVQWLYHAVHKSVITVLASYGVHAIRWGRSSPLHRDSEPFLCFQRRTEEDLVVSGYKILGSAQRRGAHGILQHGSLLLEASPFAPQLPGLSELAGRRCGDLEMDIASEVAKAMNWTWNRGSLTAQEQLLASEIEQKRFGNPEWLSVR